MKSLFLILGIFVGSVALAKPAIIVAGDSWAFLPCLFGSVNVAFEVRHMDVEVNKCLLTSKPGARAENFLNSKAYNETLKQLSNQDVKAIYLSLGGNDMFNYWSKNMSARDESILFAKIKNNIQVVIDSFHALRPDVFILLNGYDYGYLYDQNPIKAYREIYENMGKPTAFEINSGFIRLTQVLAKVQSGLTAYIQHFGLSHYFYGAPEAGVLPFQTTPPEQISPPSNPTAYGGMLKARSAPKAMLHIFNYYVDPHHLDPVAFDYLVGHSIDHYLAKWLGFVDKAFPVKATTREDLAGTYSTNEIY